MLSYEGWFSESPQNYTAPNCQWFNEVKIQIPNTFDLIISKNNTKHGKIPTGF